MVEYVNHDLDTPKVGYPLRPRLDQPPQPLATFELCLLGEHSAHIERVLNGIENASTGTFQVDPHSSCTSPHSMYPPPSASSEPLVFVCINAGNLLDH